MKANELLLWLSARQKGSWRTFRAAVEELHSADADSDNVALETDALPLHQQLRLGFERLAHAEFFACGCEHGWRVTPPTLAAHTTGSGVRAVLCGARSPALRERALCATGNVNWETLDFPGVPDAVRVVSDEAGALASVAMRVGLHFQPDAPLAILSHLPPCDPPRRNARPSEFPVGKDWNIHEFHVSGLTWRKTDRGRDETAHVGLFRFLLLPLQRAHYFLRWKGTTFEMPRAVGLYALLNRKRRGLLRYDAPRRAFSLPGICRPPRLLERALVLCSGLPPIFDPVTGRLTYSDVPAEIAHFAAELLRQSLG